MMTAQQSCAVAQHRSTITYCDVCAVHSTQHCACSCMHMQYQQYQQSLADLSQRGICRWQLPSVINYRKNWQHCWLAATVLCMQCHRTVVGSHTDGGHCGPRPCELLSWEASVLLGVNGVNRPGFLEMVAGVSSMLVHDSRLCCMNMNEVVGAYATACYHAGLVCGSRARALLTWMGLKVLCWVTADCKWCYGDVHLWNTCVWCC